MMEFSIKIEKNRYKVEATYMDNRTTCTNSFYFDKEAADKGIFTIKGFDRNKKFVHELFTGIFETLKNHFGNNIYELHLENNVLNDLPQNINTFSSLKKLSLSGNCLKKLPTLNGLISLEYLDLSNNYFLSLGDSLDGLTSLKNLILNNNPLESLPNNLVKLPHFNSLTYHFSSEKISHTDLSHIHHLKAISYLKKNKMKINDENYEHAHNEVCKTAPLSNLLPLNLSFFLTKNSLPLLLQNHTKRLNYLKMLWLDTKNILGVSKSVFLCFPPEIALRHILHKLIAPIQYGENCLDATIQLRYIENFINMIVSILKSRAEAMEAEAVMPTYSFQTNKIAFFGIIEGDATLLEEIKHPKANAKIMQN